MAQPTLPVKPDFVLIAGDLVKDALRVPEVAAACISSG